MSAKQNLGGGGYLKRKEGKQISACRQTWSSVSHVAMDTHEDIVNLGSMCVLAALLHLTRS